MKYVVFSHKGKELCAYTLKEEFAGERNSTLELLAEENNISKDDIEVSIKDTSKHKKPPINIFNRNGEFTPEFKDYVNSFVDKEVAKVTTNGEFDRDKAIAYIREHSKGGKS